MFFKCDGFIGFQCLSTRTCVHGTLCKAGINAAYGIEMCEMDSAIHVLEELRFLEAVHDRTFDFGKMKCNSCILQSLVYGFQTFQAGSVD